MVHFGNDWDDVLGAEFSKDYYLSLRTFLKAEYSSQRIYPDMNDIFAALKTTPYSKVKVVIIGQDPYHEPHQAHGMCFSVQPGTAPPPSLVNIYKELQNDVGAFIPNNGYLMPWAAQGVLLLNTILTVREGAPLSHKGKGWEIFTDRVIAALSERDDPIIFLLWGAHAQAKAELIDKNRHFILMAPHPSPLSASRGFFGCRHFSKANDLLLTLVKSPIVWQIPNL